jgi:DNA-binding transcriptional ArsR family regulator
MLEDDDNLNRLLRALADTTRRQIIDELGKQERQSLFELFSRVMMRQDSNITRQGFSRHLASLEEAGLITIEWDGKTKYHSLNSQPIAHMLEGWIEQFKE